MRVFPSALAAAFARHDGPGPVWFLRCTAAGTDYVLGQDATVITPWGRTALPLIASWGQLTEGVTGSLSDYNIANLTVNLINDPSASPNMRSLVKARAFHGITFSVYIWVDGCTDAPFEMFRFRMTEPNLPDESSVNLTLQDESAKYEQYFPGTIVTRTEFPYADPDDVGKLLPIPFGSVKKLRTLALDAGIQTSLTANINATATSFDVGDTTGLIAGTLIMIDDEGMEITGVSGDTITVTRGVGGTMAINHQRGATVWEQRDEFLYVAADYPMASIGKVYAVVGDKKLNVTAVATKYTGQAGSEHPSLPGLAVVSMPGYITVSQAVALLTTNGSLQTVDGTQLLDQLNLVDALQVAGGYTYTEAIALIDQLGLTGGTTYSENITLIDALTLISGGKNWNAGDLSYLDAGHGHTTGTTSTSTTQSPSTSMPTGLTNANLNHSNPSQYVTFASIIFPNPGTITASTLHITVTVANGALNRSSGVSMWRILVTGDGSYAPYTYNGDVANFAITTTLNVQGAMNCHTVSLQLCSDMYYDKVGIVTGTITAATRDITYVVSGVATSSVAAAIDRGAGTGLAFSGSDAELAANTPTATGSTRIYRDPTSGLTQGGSPTDFTHTVNNRVVRTPNVGSGLTPSGSAPYIPQAVNNRIYRGTGTIQKQNTSAKWAELTGSIAISGNSVANTLIGEAILVDVVSPITAPQDCLTHLSGTTCQLRGTFPAGYAFNGAITVSKKFPEWAHVMARQCRSYFKWVLGSPTLIARPDALTPVKSIPRCQLNGGAKVHGQRLTDIYDVINTINLRYDRDWSATGSGDEVYQQVATDATPAARAASIAAYGVRERPDLFKFDFITSPTMAASLVAFYLAWYAWQRWRHTQEVDISEAALEFGDAATLAFLESEIGEVTEMGFNPGKTLEIDKIQMTVTE